MKTENFPAGDQATRLLTDLDDMYELDDADRYSFVRGVMASDERWQLDNVTHPEALQAYYIRDSKGDGRGTQPSDLSDVHQAGDQVFTRLGQCAILEVDTNVYRPYLRANLSECSVLVARDEHRLWAAHVGFSGKSQVQHAIEHLQDRGFSVADLVVVASVGQVQEHMNAQGYIPRLAHAEDYVSLGIKPANITTFNYSLPTQENPRLNRGLCEVTIGPDGMLVTTFDADMFMEHGWMRELIHPESVQERFVPAA